METLKCPECFVEHTLERVQDSVVCCGQRIVHSQAIRDRVKEIDSLIRLMHCEAVRLESELFRRERLRTMTDVKGNKITRLENFWQNVHGVPRQQKWGQQKGAGATRQAGSASILVSKKDLADFF